ncbi:MAG: outer membrane lipid asymmetry maintenance protein MlaD [Pseudomonadota bacterium]
MASSAAETVIGAAVLAVAGGFLVYAANTADVAIGGGGYEVTSEFRKIEGLTVGGNVQISGVKVGTISAIELNTDRYRPVVSMTLRENVKVPEDSLVEISSEGLLGGNYLNIIPGASDFMIEPGGELDSEPYVSLIDLIKIAMKNL